MSGSAQGLPDELFAPLSARIAEVSGIRIPEGKRWLLASRVQDRMQRVGEVNAHAYVRRVLDGGAAELQLLVEAVRVGETQFFRHKGQLRAIRKVIPELLARRAARAEKGLKVWSAGCASGEEPYTIAMLLEDACPASAGHVHEVLATDISEGAIEAARRGRYPAASVREVADRIAAFAFTRDGDEVVVSDRVRACVRFSKRNLLDPTYPSGFDLVLCRNVLIYFDRPTQHEVVARLAAAVRPGGYLALGYSERLEEDLEALTAVRSEDGVLYRRRAEDDAPPVVKAPEKRGARRSSFPPPPRARKISTVPPPATRALPALVGELEGAEGLRVVREIVTGLLDGDGPAILDLRKLTFADDRVAKSLARAATTLDSTGRTLYCVAVARGTVRFLGVNGIAPPARIVRAPSEVPR